MSRPRMRRLPRASLLLVAAAMSTGVVACGTPGAALPEGVSVVVYQPRTDIPLGRLAIQVVNESGADLEVVGAHLTSPDFAADVVWPRDATTVPNGGRVDLRAALPSFDCAARQDVAAWLEVRLGDAVVASAVAFDDPFDLLPRIRVEQCVAGQVAAVATVTPRELLVAGDREPAVLVIDVEPTGAPGTITLDAVDGTTLLQPAIDGAPAPDRLELGAELGVGGVRELRIPLVPNRCDPHAVAEDKIGTIIPFTVTTAAATGVRWPLALPTPLRAALYDYVAGYCGFPGAG